MLAISSNNFVWFQLSLNVIFLGVWVFGAGALLFVGGHFIAKSPKATYWWSVLTNVASSLAGCFVFFALCVFVEKYSPRHSQINPWLPGFVVGLPVTWLVIKAMFNVPFGKAVLAWLPAIGNQAVLVGLFMTLLSLVPPHEGHRQAICATNLNGIEKAIYLYQAENSDQYPPSFDYLVKAGLNEKMLHCPSDESDRKCSYFYLAPETRENRDTKFMACDLRNNHKGEFRNVLYCDLHIASRTEAEFQAELARPENRAFAEALKKAEGP